MTLTRAELVKRLKKLAESEPPKNLAMGAMCYAPGPGVCYVRIPCPECKEGLLTFANVSPFDPRLQENVFGEEGEELYTMYKGIFEPNKQNLWTNQTFEEFITKLKKFFQARIERDPRCFDSLPMPENLSILKAYKKAFNKVKKQGINAKLIIPEYCPRCGLGLHERKFLLEINYPGQNETVQVVLEDAFDLELMVLFLQRKDRFVGEQDQEHSIKNAIDRLKEIFGIKEEI